MPLFEYRCKKCGAVTEVLVRRPADEDNVRCDACNSAKVAKMLSAAAVSVKHAPSCGLDAPCHGEESRCKSSMCQLAR